MKNFPIEKQIVPSKMATEAVVYMTTLKLATENKDS